MAVFPVSGPKKPIEINLSSDEQLRRRTMAPKTNVPSSFLEIFILNVFSSMVCSLHSGLRSVALFSRQDPSGIYDHRLP